MPNYSINDVLLVRYPFTDLSGVKVRPAVVVHAPHPSQDSFVVPLTSRLASLQPGEFVLAAWEKAGLAEDRRPKTEDGRTTDDRRPTPSSVPGPLPGMGKASQIVC